MTVQELQPFTQARAPAPAPEAELWRRYREEGDAVAREQLICHHLSYARIMAATYYARRFNDEIDFADYLQLASMGLIEAIDRFDPGHGVQFRTFASRRVHGAILNGLEHETEKQQQIAARKRLQTQRTQAAKAMAASGEEGEDGGGDADAADKAAPRAGAQVLKYLAEVGLGLALSWMLEDTGMVAGESEKSESVPFYRGVEIQQLRQKIAELVNQLPAQQRSVIRSHYLQGLAFEEIATMSGLTKGRISQIHRAALTSLREAVRSREHFEVAW